MAREKWTSRIGAPASRVIASAIFDCCSRERLRELVPAGVCPDAVVTASAVENATAKMSCSNFVIHVPPRLPMANALGGTWFRFWPSHADSRRLGLAAARGFCSKPALAASEIWPAAIAVRQAAENRL